MAFRSNVVLRWEYRPGSTLFLVWQQSREDFGTDSTFRSGGAFRDLTHTMPENVFLVKLNSGLASELRDRDGLSGQPPPGDASIQAGGAWYLRHRPKLTPPTVASQHLLGQLTHSLRRPS